MRFGAQPRDESHVGRQPQRREWRQRRKRCQPGPEPLGGNRQRGRDDHQHRRGHGGNVGNNGGGAGGSIGAASGAANATTSATGSAIAYGCAIATGGTGGGTDANAGGVGGTATASSTAGGAGFVKSTATVNGGAGATTTGSDGGYYSGPRANLNASDGARFHRRGQNVGGNGAAVVVTASAVETVSATNNTEAGAPHAASTGAMLTANSNIKVAFGELNGLHASGDSGGSQTTTSTSNETVDLTKLAVRGDLIVGFYQPMGTALGASTRATCTLTVNGYQFINQTFSRANAATLTQTYFTNHGMELGLLGSGFLGGNTLTLQATMTVTTGAGNSGFFGALIIGDPPSATGPATTGSRPWRR